MQILVSGKHLEIGESLHNHIEKRLEEVIQKYLGRVVNLNVVITKTPTVLRQILMAIPAPLPELLSKAAVFPKTYTPLLTLLLIRLKKQLRRYKRRLTNHHKTSNVPEAEVVSAIVAKKYVLKDHEEEPHEDAPVIIAEKPTEIETLTVSAAVMKMDLAELPALMFFNSANGRINVVYKRADGNISWVDPEGKAA